MIGNVAIKISHDAIKSVFPVKYFSVNDNFCMSAVATSLMNLSYASG